MKRPLSGCRVLDLGIITAGAAASALLADLGAEVIKVESPSYRDPFRAWKSSDPGAAAQLSPFFRFTNRNKTGISLDLKHADGREALLRLVAKSDVVLENFRRGVLARLAIDYTVLRAIRPEIILASISSQGETGPDANYVSFGTTLEAMAGLAWQTGYPEGDPTVSGRDLNYPDQVVAIFAAGMVAAAWRHRCKTGQGAHLDMSQRELTSFLVGEAFGATGSHPARQGNADPAYALQECFRTVDGTWLALSVLPEQAAALDALATGDGNRAGRVTRWIGARPMAECLTTLAAIGLAVAPVLDGRGVLEDRGQRWGQAIASLEDGAPVKGFPFQLEQAPLSVSRDAPRIGADTAEILQRLAGYSPEEIRRLSVDGAIECATT